MVTVVWNTEDLPLVEDDQVREYLSKLDKHKSIGPDTVLPQVLRDMDCIIVRPLHSSFITE